MTTSLPLILGSKGYFYWFKTTETDNDQKKILGLQPNSQVNSNETGFNFINSDLLGGDFINLNNDPNNLNVGFNSSKYNYSLMGCDTNRTYLGLRSTRTELFKLHKFISINETELMNLELQSWYGKGFIKMYSQRPEISSPGILNNFIDTSNIKTKKIWEPKSGGYLPTSYENKDSSFYDITLLKNKLQPNMFNNFYLGIQNRRTDPLIFAKNLPTNTNNTDSSMQFYTTAEFDEFITKDSSYNMYNCKLPKSYWKDQYWKRLGCREMNIKFNYQNQDTNKYCLLKIQELGANDTNLTNQFWMKEPYHHLVDTIIGQDKNLVVRLLPGEGKLLKVTVIPIGNFNGFLDYSNQRKIVSYQITQPNIRLNGSDTIRYYAVYDKYIDTNYARRKGVFIRRSKPTYRFDVTHNINWEDQEYMVSDSMNIYTGLLNGDNSYTSNRQECRNPSIVVRYDNITQMIKAYIVYTCRDYYDGFKYNGDVGLVVESVLDNLNANSLTIPTPIAISNYNASTRIDDWGTPVVNASYNGNYYSWSDSLYGIGIGWKRPNELYWNPNNLQKKYIPNQNEYKISVHPSVNSYSRVRLSENDCSLVWAERVWDNVNQGYLDDGNIYYTRLRISNDSLVNYIPKIDNSQYSTGYQSYYDSTVYCLNRDYYSEITRNNRFPVVYRTVEDGQFIPPGTPAEYLKYKYDKVFFEGEDVNFGTDGRAIFMVTLPSLDTIVSQLYLPKFITQNYPYKIWHQTKDLSNPNSAQGRKSTVQMLSPTYYPSDTAVTVNFMAFDRNSTPAENSDIWSLVFDYDKTDGMNAITNDTLVTSYKRATLTSINGKNVNLSAAPFSNSPYDYNVRRRIFENYYLNQDEPKIFGTQEKLFKKPFEDDGIYHLFGMKDTSQFCIFSHMIIKDENNNLYEPQLYTNKKDSVWSEWIRIKDINKLFFYTNGNYRTMNLKLQRKSDGRLFNLPFNIIAYRKLSKHIITVLNNNNQEYRFLWTKISNRFKKIQNETMLGYVTNPLESEYTSDFNKTANDEDITREIIDLREEINENEIDLDLGVNLYPNPVEEIINLNVFSNICKKVQIELINNLSQIVFSKELKTNNLTQISTEGISTGVYFLKIEDCESDKFIIKKIMIKK